MLGFFRRGLDRKGQSTSEYIIIVVIVAILSIGVITVFGKRIRALFALSSERIVGVEGMDPSQIGDPGSHVDLGLEDLGK